MSGVEAHLQLRRPDFALDVALSLPDRGVSALFGPSGAGKTTVLRCLAGLERAPGGRITVRGEVWQDEARGLFVPAHQRAVGYVFQDARLFPHLTVRANLAFGWQRLPPAARRVPFDHAVTLLDLGALLERRPATLSGGERQRVAIGRALLTSPRLLLLDEPLAALDAARRAEVLPYLERLHTELALPVVLVSHAADEVARLADHLVLLARGQVVASGPLPTLLARLDLAMALRDEAGVVLPATVAAHDPAYHLTQLAFAGGTLWVPGRPGDVGHAVRCRVLARDVSLALAAPQDTSLLNAVPARVAELGDESPGLVLVRLDAGGAPLLARITRKSADALGLRPDLAVWALIKGVALLGRS